MLALAPQIFPIRVYLLQQMPLSEGPEIELALPPGPVCTGICHCAWLSSVFFIYEMGTLVELIC